MATANNDAGGYFIAHDDIYLLDGVRTPLLTTTPRWAWSHPPTSASKPPAPSSIAQKFPPQMSAP